MTAAISGRSRPLQSSEGSFRYGSTDAPHLLAFAISFAPAANPAYAAPNASLDRWQRFITEAALRFNVPEAWIRAVIQAESGGQTMLSGRPITSRAGAMGLMQVMPGTYEALRRAHDLGADPYDPRDNILAGTAYLRAMYDRFGYPGLFAAYNAGPERYDEHLQYDRPLPAETRAYLSTIVQVDTGSPPDGVPGLGNAAVPHVANRRRFSVRLPSNDAAEHTFCSIPNSQRSPVMPLWQSQLTSCRPQL